MSINEQIEAAWKAYKPEALQTNSMALSHDVFAAGYRASLRKVLVISPEQMEVGMRAISLVRGVGWREGLLGSAMGSFNFGWIDKNSHWWVSCQDCLHICRVCDWLPSPSEVFGEEGV